MGLIYDGESMQSKAQGQMMKAQHSPEVTYVGNARGRSHHFFLRPAVLHPAVQHSVKAELQHQGHF